MKKLVSLIITALFALTAAAQTTPISITLTADPTSVTMKRIYYEYTEFTIDVNLINNVPIMAVQFDIKLPDGVILYSGTRSERCSANMAVSVNKYGEAWRVVMAGMNHPIISGSEGRICTLKLRAKSDIELYSEPFLYSDNYSLNFFNVKCACKLDPDTYYPTNCITAPFSTTVSVDASALDIYPLGDLDKSKTVTVIDLDTAARALAADDEKIKARKEADVNWDGQFSIADITALIKKLNK